MNNSSALQVVVDPPTQRTLALPAEPVHLPPNTDFVVDPFIDRFDLAFILRKHWWKLVLFPLLGALLAVPFYLKKEPLFQSKATMLVDPSFEEIIQFENVDGGSGDDMPGLRSLEVAMVSDSVILRVVDRLELRKESGFLPQEMQENPNLTDSELVTFLRENRVEAALMPDTRLIEISVLDPDPARAQRIADAFTTEFENFVSDQRLDEVDQARASLERQAERARESALASEEKLKEFRQNNPDYPVEQDHDLFSASLSKLGEERNTLSEERRKLENQKKILQGIDPDKSPLEVIEVAQYRDVSHVSELLTSITQAKTKLGVVAERYGPKHPSYITAEREMKRYEEQLRDLAQDIVAAVDAKFIAAKAREEELSKELAGEVSDLGEMKSASSEFRALHQQAERDWQIHEALQTKLRESAISSEISSQIATVVSEPLLPHEKASPDLLLHLVLGGGLGGLFGAGFVACALFAGLPFSDSRQAEQRLGVPIIADWSEDSWPADSCAGTTGPVNSTRLLSYLGSTGDKTIQISAPHLNGIGESVSLQVARLAAQNGKRTLVVSVKEDGADMEVQPTDDPNLYRIDILPQTVRDYAQFRAGIENLKNYFDNIFFDTASVGDPDLVEFLSTQSDLDVMVVGKNKTKKQIVEERLTKLGRGHRSQVALIMVSPDSHSHS